MSKTIKAFYRLTRQSYFKTMTVHPRNVVEEFNIGKYDSEGEGCEYEFKIVYQRYEGKVALELQIPDEAWEAFSEMSHFFMAIDLEFRKTDTITPDELQEILLKLRFTEMIH